jgi:hypothetical protein
MVPTRIVMMLKRSPGVGSEERELRDGGGGGYRIYTVGLGRFEFSERGSREAFVIGRTVGPKLILLMLERREGTQDHTKKTDRINGAEVSTSDARNGRMGSDLSEYQRGDLQ